MKFICEVCEATVRCKDASKGDMPVCVCGAEYYLDEDGDFNLIEDEKGDE